MSVQESFQKIAPAAIQRASNRLARGAGVRENLQPLLEKMLARMEQAALAGDPTWVDAIVTEWAQAGTQSDLEGVEQSLPRIVREIIGAVQETISENLPPPEALSLLNALQPVFLHALEKAVSAEFEGRLEYANQERTKLAAKLERVDKSKSNFTSVAGHELKTPLTLIEGYTAMVGELVPRDSDQVHLLIQGVHNGIKRLREIVDDMIDVSMIDNGLMNLNYQPVWLNRMFTLLRADFIKTLEERKQTLDIHEFPGSKELIFADQERLYQVFKNLLSNAIKYTRDGGKIVIDGRTLPGFIEVTMKDNGIGINPENQELIFEKFGQLGSVALHSSGKTKFKGGGPGLGLPIARGIIEMHGGSLWVESPGYNESACPGSTFHVMIPIRTQPEDPKIARLFGAEESLPGALPEITEEDLK